MTNESANHNNCEAKVSRSNGGNAPLWPSAGTSVCAAVAIASGLQCRGTFHRPALEREQQQQGDQQREDAERFGHREAEDQVGELALGGGGVAQCGGEIMAK